MQIVHEIPGRMRFRLGGCEPVRQVLARAREAFPQGEAFLSLSYNPRTRRYLAVYDGSAQTRRTLLLLLGFNGTARTVAGQDRRRCAGLPDASPPVPVRYMPARSPVRTEQAARVVRARARACRGEPSLLLDLLLKTMRFLAMRPLTPPLLRPFTLLRLVGPVLGRGMRALGRRRVSVDVLDAAAVGVSLLLRDTRTAQSISFLLSLGEDVEQWTREKTRASVAPLLLGEDRPAWILRDGRMEQVPAGQLRTGYLVVVEAGSRIPVDGLVQEGHATVNQSSLTGEALAAPKKPGSTVYAGTAVEEGRLVVEATGVSGQTSLAKIVRLIEASEERKAALHGQAERLAERIVPLTFCLSAVVLLLTRNVRKAASVLLVDYSCALKLATPLAVKSAMSEAARHGMLVKGGKYMQLLAEADTVVLDKTGTLTAAKPRVVDVRPFNSYARDFVLRNAACLEEHFPHPVATAVIKKAEEEDLRHEERHAKVEYIAAHGIASWLDGERILLGSRHFVHEDEGVDVSEADSLWNGEDDGRSLLYMAVGGRLAGVLLIEDTLLEQAPRFVSELKALGLRVVMLTGDHERSARKVARELGIDEYHSQVLPDGKTRIVRQLQSRGSRVVMVGDGMNDSAALAQADVGVSMRHGAEVAQEACDILLLAGDLGSLVTALRLSRRLMARVRTNFSTIVGVNTALIILGIAGRVQPALSATLHNLTTVAVSVGSTRPLLSESRQPRKACLPVPPAATTPEFAAVAGQD